jgi:hypothetical protein
MTAREFLDNVVKLEGEEGMLRKDQLSYIMTRFTKLHVEAALKEASENVDMDKEYYESLQEGSNGGIDMETILSAYPFENIK